jgi:hypothetical protein
MGAVPRALSAARLRVIANIIATMIAAVAHRHAASPLGSPMARSAVGAVGCQAQALPAAETKAPQRDKPSEIANVACEAQHR